MKINEKYLEALKTFNEYVLVSEWAQRVGEIYPDLLANANEQAAKQKNDTTGLREIAARLSSALSSGSFGKNVHIDDTEKPRKVKYLSNEEQITQEQKNIDEDTETFTRQEIINNAKDKLKILEVYRLDEFRNIQKSFKDHFGLDLELDHAKALLNEQEKGEHHPNNIQLLSKFHNTKKNNSSWKRFSFDEQVKYIKDAIQLQSNVAQQFDLELNDDILQMLFKRLKEIY